MLEMWIRYAHFMRKMPVCWLPLHPALLIVQKAFAATLKDSLHGPEPVCNSMKREHSDSILQINAIFTQELTVSFTERVTISSFFQPATPFWLMKKVILKFFTTTHLSYLIPEIFTPNIPTHHHAQSQGNLRYLLFGSPQGSS